MARKDFQFSIPRLITAWRNARVADQQARAMRLALVREYVGPDWGEQGAQQDIPVNLLSLFISTFGRSLVPKTPRFLLSTFDRAQRAACDTMEAAGNRDLERMKANVTFRRIVIDALFGVGVGRVALTTPQEAANRGWGPTAGEPVMSRIDREDFAYDTLAGDMSECAWLGHKYRCPLIAVKENKVFQSGRKTLRPTRNSPYDEYGVEKVEVISRSFYGQDEFEDMVELWEFYLPRHKRIITLHCSEDGTPQLCEDDKPLGDQAWIGPENGPYYVLGYLWVPGNAMPKGPIQDLAGLHFAANQFFRKAIWTAQNMKEETLFLNEEDAKRVQDEADGGMTYCEHPEAIQTRVFGGQHIQAVMGMATAMKAAFNEVGGNLELLGGRGPQAKTAHQEEILNQNAGAAVVDYQETTTNFIGEMIQGWCWYAWKHPYKVMTAEAKVDGLPGVATTRRLYPGAVRGVPYPHQRPDGSLPDVRQRRQTRFEDLDCRIDPYSLAPQTPQGRLALLRQIVKEDVLPLMPLLQKDGVSFDANAYFQKLGKYTDDPDLEQILTIRQMPTEPGGEPEKPGMAAQTERTYTRENASTKTQQGQDKSAVTQMLTGNNQGGAQQPQFAGV